MATKTVAWHGFTGGGQASESTDDAAQIALQFGTNPQVVRQEGNHLWQVGQQVRVNGDRELRTTLRGDFDGPIDVGLWTALLADEKCVAPAWIPGLEFPNVGPTVEVDQTVTMRFTVPHEGLVALAERMRIVEVARCADEGPDFVG